MAGPSGKVPEPLPKVDQLLKLGEAVMTNSQVPMTKPNGT